jgi:DNA processing protein
LRKLHPDLLYQIALTLVPNVGCIKAKKIIAYCGSAKAALASHKEWLQKIQDIGKVIAQNISTTQVMLRAEQELEFCQKNNITPYSFLDDNYPHRLLQCEDSPIVLYVKGSANLNAQRIVSVVGTRAATNYGRQICDEMMRDFADMGYQPLIVSGLAYGIDVAAHRAALKHGLPTAAVVAHGLDMLYPPDHKRVLEEMLYAGGALISDYISGTTIHPAYFLARNRIIAGLADAVVVVESAAKGGSLSTARLAMDYARDVFTFPARIDDKNSAGCNALIRDNKAALATCAQDIALALRWDSAIVKNAQHCAVSAFDGIKLSAEEDKIYRLLCADGSHTIDEICQTLQIPIAEISVALLSLEFNGMVRALPGKVFEGVQ